MMMKKYNLYIILFICTLSSCSDFLEESSQDLMIPRSVKDYKELFFGQIEKSLSTINLMEEKETYREICERYRGRGERNRDKEREIQMKGSI